MKNDKKDIQTNFYGEVKGHIHTGSGDMVFNKGQDTNNSGAKENLEIQPKRLSYILFLLDAVAIMVACLWAYKSNWDYEPLVVIIGLLGGLIVLIVRLYRYEKAK